MRIKVMFYLGLLSIVLLVFVIILQSIQIDVQKVKIQEMQSEIQSEATYGR